jgi:hypothetical protein
VNKIIRTLGTGRVAVALCVGMPFAVVGALVDRHLPILVIPVLPAALAAALLVVLGVILGRASDSGTLHRSAPSAQVTASAVRPVAASRSVPLPSSAPTYAVLPAVRQDGGDLA